MIFNPYNFDTVCNSYYVDRPVCTGASQHLAIRTETQRKYGIAGSYKCPNQLTICCCEKFAVSGACARTSACALASTSG